MIKVLIADDEPRIRRGIKKTIGFESEVNKKESSKETYILANSKGSEEKLVLVGEAEDGEGALRIAKEEKPDILFLDICMPFINGIDLIKEIKKVLDNPIIIVISGHDEFNYVQAALRLNIYDYILKPVDKVYFKNLIEKAKREIVLRREAILNNKKNNNLVSTNIYYLKSNFFIDWINGDITSEELKICLEDIEFNYSNSSMGIIYIRVLENNFKSIKSKNEKDLIDYGIINIIEDKINKSRKGYVFKYSTSKVIIISEVESIKVWMDFVQDLEETIRNLLKVDILIEKSLLPKEPLKLKDVFNNLEKSINERSNKTPIVLEIEKYINKNYSNDKLTIDDVAKNIRISQTYLTRLLKKEIGMSFIDYLTYIRIQNSIELMADPTIKIYEIANLVGYNTQHYFSNVFKKHMGVSPNEYRSYINNEE